MTLRFGSNTGLAAASVLGSIVFATGVPGAFSADKPERRDIDEVLASLVRLGVPEARQLEAALARV